ncbi:amino acid oxidase [Phytohabitans aurantiacus]|uniref:D-amino-acid oxidase n=1 Tax=Phytohabitans aurantiacus TaxID=3016789 RepID=A0ABQ5QYF9_9ACTN|nr:amino acid oxidase [Phytohabitans aurantiacus]
MTVNVNLVTLALVDVLVIGAGVSGLTTAVCLAEAGYAVRVCATRLPRDTTSCAAGALWGPYLVEEDNRVERWSFETRLALELLHGAGVGVRLVRGIEAARSTVEPPSWATTLDGFAVCRPDELPSGYASGWWYRAPIVDMPSYLDYLARRLTAAGGKVEIGVVTSLDEATTQAPIAVNCTGSGARTLVPDTEVTPISGQLVVVDNPGIEHFFAEYGHGPELTYIFPHGDNVVLGGTALPGRSDTTPDPVAAAAIMRRCAAVEPRLAEARIRDVRVGVRPSRPMVRLECVEMAGRHLIHNYGHGGSGVTLSWGCARDVLAIVNELA